MNHKPIPSLLRPLGLSQALTTPDKQLDVAPLFDVLLIVAMFFVLGSRFVFAPGLNVSLPVSPVPGLGGVATVDVMTVKGKSFIIYQETKYTLGSLAKAMKNPEFTRPPANTALLVRADQSVDMQTFIDISELAREAGYHSVQLAVKEPASGLMAPFQPAEEAPPALFAQ